MGLALSVGLFTLQCFTYLSMGLALSVAIIKIEVIYISQRGFVLSVVNIYLFAFVWFFTFCGIYLEHCFTYLSTDLALSVASIKIAVFCVSQHGSCTFCCDYLEHCFTSDPINTDWSLTYR